VRAIYILLTLTLAGCPAADDDDIIPGDEVSVDGRCTLGETGPALELEVAETGSAILEETSQQAQNTSEIDAAAATGSHVLGAIRIGPCGEVGMAASLRGNSPHQLAYLDLGSGVVTDLGTSYARPGLLFDDACAPLVLTPYMTEIVEHRRDGDDWTSRTAFDVLDLGIGDDVSLAAVDRDPGGGLHVLAHAWADGGMVLVHGSRPAAAGSDWTAEQVPMPDATDVWDFAADAAGRLHTVYRQMDTPCDPCDVSLRYAVLQGGGGWQEEVVEEGLWGPPHDELATDATLAIDDQDEPVIAASFATRAVTGSVQSQALRVYARRGGELCVEQPVTQSDGYTGSDGTDFTGALPALELDDEGRLHILFADLAAWHDGTGRSNSITGQLRYALRAGQGWQVATPLVQAGPSASPQPLRGMTAPTLAVSADGALAAAASATWSWDTDSIHNDDQVPLDITSSLRSLATEAR